MPAQMHFSTKLKEREEKRLPSFSRQFRSQEDREGKSFTFLCLDLIFHIRADIIFPVVIDVTDFPEYPILHDAIFWGDSKERLRDFPEDARREAGVQIFLVQTGRQPDDFRPMPSVGLGVEEIRIREDSGAYRVFYIARFDNVVYVLHAFQKKTQKTPKKEIELGKARYKDLMKWRKENEEHEH